MTAAAQLRKGAMAASVGVLLTDIPVPPLRREALARDVSGRARPVERDPMVEPATDPGVQGPREHDAVSDAGAAAALIGSKHVKAPRRRAG
jgi:hypothetical protein